MSHPLPNLLPYQVKENLEMNVLEYKYDLSLVNEAIKAIQLGQHGEDVVSSRLAFSLPRHQV